MPNKVGAASDGPKSGEVIRGSTELNLSSEGKEHAAELNKHVKRLGGFWRIYYSSQMRAAHSAHLVTQGTETKFMAPSPELESWHLGGYEGKLVKDVLVDIQDLVAERPWVIPPGMGPESTKPGESFNQFKNRVLDKIRELMALWEEHPTKRIAAVTHFHNIQLVDSWLAKYDGQPGNEDTEYDSKIYNLEVGEPGEILWLHKVGKKWKFDRIDITKWPTLPPGIYFIRHFKTGWNK